MVCSARPAMDVTHLAELPRSGVGVVSGHLPHRLHQIRNGPREHGERASRGKSSHVGRLWMVWEARYLREPSGVTRSLAKGVLHVVHNGSPVDALGGEVTEPRDEGL